MAPRSSCEAPPSLVWTLLKCNNKFVVRRNGITLSTERGNLMNMNSEKYSGLANRRPVHIRCIKPNMSSDNKAAKPKWIVSTCKKADKAPVHTVISKPSGPAALKSVARTVKSVRRDLRNVALVRAQKMLLL